MKPSPTAIVVEDEPHIRRFVRAALEAEGWQVHEAATQLLQRLKVIDADVQDHVVNDQMVSHLASPYKERRPNFSGEKQDGVVQMILQVGHCTRLWRGLYV